MAEPRLDVLEFVRGEQLSCGERVLIGAAGGPAERVVLGDNVTLGDDVRILAPRVTIGDYTTIHNHTTIYGYDEVRIGPCCWIGQNCVLNCNAALTLGRGVTFGAYSNIWTHFSGGDPVEGCNFDSRQAALIEDDAWIGVQCTIAPVTIEEKALVLAGSVVTKDVLANRAFGGNPAVDLTYKVGAPWRERPLEDKFIDMCHRLRGFMRLHPQFSTEDDPLTAALDLKPEQWTNPQTLAHAVEGVFTLGQVTITMGEHPEDATSIFDLRDRSYSKLRSEQEIAFMRYLLPQVKFYPRGA